MKGERNKCRKKCKRIECTKNGEEEGSEIQVQNKDHDQHAQGQESKNRKQTCCNGTQEIIKMLQRLETRLDSIENIKLKNMDKFQGRMQDFP